MNVIQKLHYRYPKNQYIQSFMSMIDGLGGKMVSAFVLQLTSLGIGDIYLQMLESPVELVALIAFLVVMDFVSGLINAFRSPNESVRSAKMRSSVIKVLEYTIFLVVITAIANSFESQSELANYVTPHIELFAYFLVTIIEANSIIENLMSQNIKHMWDKIKKKFNLNQYLNE